MAFACPKLKVAMTLIAKFHHSMDRLSLTCVQGLVDGCQFRNFADDIAKFLGFTNEGVITYFENVTFGDTFQQPNIMEKC